MDPRTTKAITGHSSGNVHDEEYHHEDVDVMAREIEKIPRFLENGDAHVASSEALK
jgi:hypothetical protein